MVRQHRATRENLRGKALSFGVLDWKQLEKWKDISTKAASSTSLELDLSTGVVKRSELDLNPQTALGKFSQEYSADAVKRRLDHPQKEESYNASELSSCSTLERNHKSTSKKERDASPNRRFSFSFSQMSRSFSSKESSSASQASGPLTNGHSTTPVFTTVRALLQFTLRKGINLFQFVVENNNTVLAATMKRSDSCTQSYTLYSIKGVTTKTDSWLGRHRNEEKNHPFAHTIIGQMKTVTCFTSDLATYRSQSVLFGVETNQELAAIVQTRSTSQSQSQRHSTTTIILPSGVHTLPKDGNAPLPLIERWKSGGACDCGGWDIGCKLRVFYCDDRTKPHSFQLFDQSQERDQPLFNMVTHNDEHHSVEFGSTLSLLEAFFISLAVSSHHSWCQVLIGDGPFKRETPAKYASHPPVSPIGRV